MTFRSQRKRWSSSFMLCIWTQAGLYYLWLLNSVTCVPIKSNYLKGSLNKTEFGSAGMLWGKALYAKGSPTWVVVKDRQALAGLWIPYLGFRVFTGHKGLCLFISNLKFCEILARICYMLNTDNVLLLSTLPYQLYIMRQKVRKLSIWKLKKTWVGLGRESLDREPGITILSSLRHAWRWQCLSCRAGVREKEKLQKVLSKVPSVLWTLSGR